MKTSREIPCGARAGESPPRPAMRSPATAIRLVTAIFACTTTLSAQVFEDYRHTVEAPYAGRYEARIGGSAESDAEKVRLDIGASVDLYTIGDTITGTLGTRWEHSRLTFGADFFTWSRLRSEPNFKFPVEDVDYYFGVHAALALARVSGRPPLISDFRLRIGHISAHAVDGSERYSRPDSLANPFVYSREFLDAMAASDGSLWGRIVGVSPGTLRPYVGVLWIFHNIPTLAGRATPYAGLDMELPLGAMLPLTVRFGYEFRLNTEADPGIGENLARIGLKLGRPGSNGLLVEGGYFTGRSPYGQHFAERESYMFVGFGFDF